VPVAHACNLSYSRGRYQKDHDLKLPWANSSQDPIVKMANPKRADGVTQVTECLPSKHETLSSRPDTTKQRKKEKNEYLIFWILLNGRRRYSWKPVKQKLVRPCLKNKIQNRTAIGMA
jgi:hypothetical protein